MAQMASDSKGRYIHGMVKLIGGLSEMSFFHSPYMITLFSNAQLRKGTAFTIKQLHQIANPAEHSVLFHKQMQQLVAKRVFLRGYRLQCATCDLDMWYVLSAVDDGVCCQGCGASIALALDLTFAYRLNELFAQGFKSGALTVLLTALHYYELCDALDWQAGVEKNGVDIDLLIQCDGKSYVVECKDNLEDDVIAQLRKYVDLDYGQVVLSTLSSNLLSKYVNTFINENDIILLRVFDAD